MSYTDVLLVEDDTVLGGALRQRLQLEGLSVQWAQNCAQAVALLRRVRLRPAFLLADIRLPDGCGEDLYRSILPYLADTTAVFATAYGDIAQAVRLVNAGADDYLTKPYDVDALVARIRQAVQVFPHAPAGDAAVPGNPFAVTEATSRTALEVQRLAGTGLAVLLEGETGVGKEVTARYMHAHSAGRDGPFVAVNCAALGEGLAEAQLFGHRRGAFSGAHAAQEGLLGQAGGGTLFLDEVGELSGRAQAVLLRVLENGSYRPLGGPETAAACRIMASSNTDLAAAVQAGTFRADLYYRFSAGRIVLPPLRRRWQDIEPLADAFLAQSHRQPGVPAVLALANDAREALLRYEWPGNVRELRNRIVRAALLAQGPVLGERDLFPEDALQDVGAPDLARVRSDAEMRSIHLAIAASGGQLGVAAKRLGISRTTLWKKLKGGAGPAGGA